jgi:hypothetical protein
MVAPSWWLSQLPYAYVLRYLDPYVHMPVASSLVKMSPQIVDDLHHIADYTPSIYPSGT